MADETQWAPVEIIGATVKSVKNGRAEIEWRLTKEADHDWITTFRPSGTRSGSGAFTLSHDEPNAYIGRIIWEVPEQDVEGADSYVRSSVLATNAAYLELLKKRAQDNARQLELQREEAMKKAELQRRLDELK